MVGVNACADCLMLKQASVQYISLSSIHITPIYLTPININPNTIQASSDPAMNRITCNVMNPGLIPTSGLFRDLNPIFVAIFTLITRYIARVAVSEEEGGRRL